MKPIKSYQRLRSKEESEGRNGVKSTDENRRKKSKKIPEKKKPKETEQSQLESKPNFF